MTVASHEEPAPPVAWQGFVSTPPTAPGEEFTVSVPGFDEDHVFQVRRWESRGGALPEVGNEVLLLLDDKEEPWVAAWWPSESSLAIEYVQGPEGAEDGALAAFDGTSGKLIKEAGPITSEMIEAIEAAKITGQITETQIAPEAVTTPKLAAGSVTAGKIVAGTITAVQIATETITASLIKAGTITATQIAAATITGTLIKGETIEAGHLKAGTITAKQIAAETITATLIKAGTITAKEIAANTITAGQIKAESITSTEIAANTITAGDIAAGTITANEIAAATITGGKIAGGTITGGNIASGTVTAGNITISKLSALSGDLGTITAGTVTGATIRTAEKGKRVIIDAEGLRAYNAGEEAVLNFNTETGNLTIKGAIQSGSTVPATVVTGLLTNEQLEAISAIKILAKDTRTNLSPSPDSMVKAILSAAAGWTVKPILASEVGELGTPPTGFTKVTESVYNSGAETDAGFTAVTFPAAGTYTVSLRCFLPASWDGKDINMNFEGYTGASEVDVSTALATKKGEWQTVACRVTVKAEDLVGSLVMRTTGNPTAGKKLYFSGLLIEAGSTLNPYIPTAAQLTAKEANWTGKEHESTSIFRPLGLPVATEIVGQLIAGQIAAEAITTEKLAAGAVTTTQIAAKTILAGNIAASTITAEQIAATTITGAKIAAETITAEKLLVSKLSAITADLGTITAGTITGVTFKTTGESPMILDNSGLSLPENLGSETFASKSVVAWRNTENKTVAEILAANVSERQTLYHWSNRNKLRAEGSLRLIATGKTGRLAQVTVVAGEESISPRISAKIEEEELVILDPGFQSNFLQLTGVLKRKINAGSVKLKWTASTLSAAVEVEHKLGTEPIAVVANCLTAPEAGKIPVANIVSKTSTKFTINAETKNSHTGEITMMWFAFG